MCIRDSTKGDIIVYSKGADNVMEALLDKNDARTKRVKKESLKHVQQYCDDGLRILLIATKTVTNAWYEAWSKRFDQAKNAESDREAKKEAVMAEIENGLSLCGVTAIEDKLQDGVPDCISACLLYTSPSPRDRQKSRMPSSA